MRRKEKSAQEVYDEFWKELVENEDGTLNKEAIQNELYDFKFLIEQVPLVYDNVTGGRISKPNTYASEVINAADDLYDAKYTEGYEDALEEYGIQVPKI